MDGEGVIRHRQVGYNLNKGLTAEGLALVEPLKRCSAVSGTRQGCSDKMISVSHRDGLHLAVDAESLEQVLDVAPDGTDAHR